MVKLTHAFAGLVASVLLTGCIPFDQDAKVEEAKAIGAACAQLSQSLEACYAKTKLPKSAVLAGWRSMQDYLVERAASGAPLNAPAEAPQSAAPAATPASEATPAEPEPDPETAAD